MRSRDGLERGRGRGREGEARRGEFTIVDRMISILKLQVQSLIDSKAREASPTDQYKTMIY